MTHFIRRNSTIAVVVQPTRQQRCVTSSEYDFSREHRAIKSVITARQTCLMRVHYARKNHAA
jgi:hypothetical protein